MSQNKPIAVLISDIHYNINTLEVADEALRMAISEANKLGVPVIIAGDLHDTKANMRAECVSAILNTMRTCLYHAIIIRGNHDSIHEKSKRHSLEFLEGHADIIDSDPIISYYIDNIVLIPYWSNVSELKDFFASSKLSSIMNNYIFIMHQGVVGSYAGDYIQDRSALMKEDLPGFRIISGHYHRRQTIDLPEGGKLDYIGNPFTLSFAEANDPEKGFQVLHEDGSLTFVPTNLRRHKILELTTDCMGGANWNIKDDDILWVKVSGTSAELSKINKKSITENLRIKQDFKLDLIPTDLDNLKPIEYTNQSNDELLDQIIDSLNVPAGKKTKLKSTWKDFSE